MTKFTCTVGRDGRKYYFKDGKRCKKSEVPQGTKCKGDKKESPVKKVKVVPKKASPIKKSPPVKKASPPKRKVFSSKALAARKPPPKPPLRAKTPPKPSPKKGPSLLDLPTDILRMMAMDFSLKNLWGYCLANQRMKKICTDDEFWKMYVKKHADEYPPKLEGKSWQWMARHTKKYSFEFDSEWRMEDIRSLQVDRLRHEKWLNLHLDILFENSGASEIKGAFGANTEIKYIEGKTIKAAVNIVVILNEDRMKDKVWEAVDEAILFNVNWRLSFAGFHTSGLPFRVPMYGITLTDAAIVKMEDEHNRGFFDTVTRDTNLYCYFPAYDERPKGFKYHDEMIIGIQYFGLKETAKKIFARDMNSKPKLKKLLAMKSGGPKTYITTPTPYQN